MTEQQASEALADFLRARLDEEEAAALAASDGPWTAWRAGRVGGLGHLEHAVMRPGQKAGSRAPIAAASWVDAEHVARHDPARALREIEAKRGLLSLRDRLSYGAEVDTSALMLRGGAYVLEVAVQWAALAYADHPDYREEWRP